MRLFPLILPACAVMACGDDFTGSRAGDNRGWTGPDAVLVQIPAEGGTVRAYRWGSDSVIFTSTQPAPPVRELLAFDTEDGALAYVDARGIPGRIELRLGSITPAATTPMTSLATVDGWAIYGINPRREMLRLTPSGNWRHPSALTPRALLPQPDGSLIMLNDLGDRSILRRIHPPEARVIDTASVPVAAFTVVSPLGDRIYFATDSGLAGVRVRDLTRIRTISLPGAATDAVPTPSGDRVFVAIAGDRSIVVIDRYEESVEGSIRLNAVPSALRMDPDGRYLLVRLEGTDSVAVVSVADSRQVAVLTSQWRADLPLVAPDGAVLALSGADVVEVEQPTGKVLRRRAGGAASFWALIRWNGFRPRAKGLDQPVSFDADPGDSITVAMADTIPAGVAAAPVTPAQPGAGAPTREEPPAATRSRPAGWTLSFAALLDEQRARALASGIRVEGHAVRVVSSLRDGMAIWRVVSGPFASRDDAERAGRRTGLPFWVYEESP